MSNQQRNRILTHYFLLIALPFVLFYWMLPFFSDQILGNDYTVYPIQHQMELMFSLKTGSFPLYVPGFAGGQSASALTLGQIFHPISHIASILPGYWNGKALEWNTCMRLFFLGFAQIALFSFLRKLRFNNFIAFLLSFITVYNLRMLDLFRYGASLESWTGFIFLCSAIGWYFINPINRFGPLFIIGATYWLICSGHPQMMYYGLIGALIFTLIIPFFIREILHDSRIEGRIILRVWLMVGLSISTGILLSSAYIIPFYFDFLTDNVRHVAQHYSWTDVYRDSFIGTLNNFFQPLRSDVHGAFGGSSLFLVAALLPTLRLFRLKIPRTVWVVWGISFFVFLYMQGSRTPLHYIVWKYFPFASSIRVAGRVSFLMPIFFMLLLGWAISARPTTFKLAEKNIQLPPYVILAATAMLVIGVYSCLPDSITKSYASFSPIALRDIPSWLEPVVSGAGIVALMALTLQGLLPRGKRTGEIILCIFTGLQIIFVLRYGTWIEPKKPTPSLSQMLSEKKENLDYRHLPGAGMASTTVLRHAERSSMEPSLGKVYKKYLFAEDNEAAYTLIEQGRLPDQVIIEGYTSASKNYPRSATSESKPDRVELIYSSFNRLIFNVHASQAGFFGLSYPYTDHWRCMLNHEQVPIYRANGAAVAIHIPEGKNLLEFRYWSDAAFWGVIISCLTLMLIGGAVGFGIIKKIRGMSLTVLIFMVSVGLFGFWYQSLYSGQDLGSRYLWEEGPSEPMVNLAYFKTTRTSPIWLRLSPDIAYIDPFLTFSSSGKAVDGDRSAGSGFISNLQPKPFLAIDLHQQQHIGSIVIYENIKNPSWNARPLIIGLSNDQQNWGIIKEINRRTKHTPLYIEFNTPHTARYVMLMSLETCQLALDEVEIYPPSN